LGGNRNGPRRTAINLAIVMLLGGLWHGASWRFVIWGGLHGLWLAGERWWTERRVASGTATMPSTVGTRILQRIVTFHLVCLAWIFFRADSLDTAWTMITRIATAFELSAPVVTPAALIAIGVGLAAQYVPRSAVERGLAGFSRLGPAVQGMALAFGLMIIDALGPEGVAAFIYFQF